MRLYVLNELLSEARTLWQMRALLGEMTWRELASRVVGSAGGLLWVWLPPLMTLAVYFLVFDLVFGMRLGEGAPAQRVGAFLVVGMLPWMAFADAVSRGMTSLVDAGGMLQKNPLPAGLFPARAVLTSLVVFAPLILLLLLLYMPSHHWRPGVLALPVLLLGQAVLSFLLAYLLAVLAAALRDVTQVAGVLLSLGVFLSPILFPVAMFPQHWRWILWLNPMTAWVLGYQSVLLQGNWPPFPVWMSIVAWLLLLGAALSVLLARSRDELVDWL